MGEAAATISNPEEHSGPWGDLLPVIEQLSLARTMESIAEIVRVAARQLSGADGVTFVLKESDSSHYLDEDAISPLWKGQRFPLESCISGWCMLNNETAVIPDVYQDPRIPKAAYQPTFVKSLVMTPVRGSNNPPAAIGAYWRTRRTPSREEVDILAVLARSTAIAIENVKLVSSLETAAERAQEQAREAARLYEAAQSELAERQKAQDRARVLFDEMQHRVKNNLTTIVAITQLQIRHTNDERVKTELLNTQRRVLAVAALHSRMVRDENSDFHFGRYVNEVCSGIRSSLLRDRTVSLTVHVDESHVELGRSMSFGLVVNELVTNAARHAFEDRESGKIDVRFRTEGDEFVLTVSDNGKGMPSGEAEQRKGLGLKLSESCIRQLEGTMTLRSENGVTWEIRAPMKWEGAAGD